VGADGGVDVADIVERKRERKREREKEREKGKERVGVKGKFFPLMIFTSRVEKFVA
jgi:hypothetical protein